MSEDGVIVGRRDLTARNFLHTKQRAHLENTLKTLTQLVLMMREESPGRKDEKVQDFQSIASNN